MQQSFLFKIVSLAVLVISFSLSACKKQEESNSQNDKATETVVLNSQNKEIEAIYKSCTVYTGSTQYFFQTEKGDTITVSVLNAALADGETLIAKVPDNLIDNNPDLEGVAGENPKMVGKKFKIIYNANGEVTEIKAN
jgi:hypothetical protein